ncbi:outer membrane protein assembly factor BamE [Wolbachia endosymbiont of Howardula sp.]|uniref:outer membrane protein assembly factor BamE n=1 Tax=Wolbachia endosymbiont of Howardula sp. TaxID=2916816 RepID=UPI00217E3E65|nr:outer membrane protein assembly factor BamE [Wolbachia endosymbiont of Howardula sp.]UWI83184.1 outer membrane protein assembly factor BamE [Wolbachia endosymbiont of Howardula sp.]
MQNASYHGVSNTMIELWNQVQIGDEKAKILEVLGTPTLISQFDSNTWYYISYQIKQANFLGKKKYSSNSLRISFNQAGIVMNIKEISISKRFLISH